MWDVDGLCAHLRSGGRTHSGVFSPRGWRRCGTWLQTGEANVVVVVKRQAAYEGVAEEE